MTEMTRHVEFNCTTGEETWRDSTPEEHQALMDRQESENARMAAEAAGQDADRALILAEAAGSPAFAALARQMGFAPPPEEGN
jgi:DNA-binding GntR family transcriptional regulator